MSDIFFSITFIVTLNGPIFQAISDDIGRYQTISGDIRVIFHNVTSGMCWVKSKSSLTGSVNNKPNINMVRPCRIRTITILLKITNNGRYRCIAYIYHTVLVTTKDMVKDIVMDGNGIKPLELVSSTPGKLAFNCKPPGMVC